MKPLLMTTLVALMTSPILAASPVFVPYGPSTNYGLSRYDNHGISDWTFQTGNLGRSSVVDRPAAYGGLDHRVYGNSYGNRYGLSSRGTALDDCRDGWSNSYTSRYGASNTYRDHDAAWKYGSVNHGWNGSDTRYRNQYPSSSWKQPDSRSSSDVWNSRRWND